jgi:hypothetical protein
MNESKEIVVCPFCEGHRFTVSWFRSEATKKNCDYCKGLGLKLKITRYEDIPKNHPPYYGDENPGLCS